MTTHTTLVTGIPVGKYEVVREIGRGGVAVVYLANQPGLERHVALKELSAAHAHDPAFADRFLREARIAGSLNHSNIVSVFDYFEIDGVPYIAMEYLSQGSLRRHMARLELAQIGIILDALLAALSHAATNSIVHRDVKPENLLIGADGVVKVADFGVAKALLSASDHNATVTGMTVGTPAYMAPEQAVGKNVGSHSDVYAAGIVAYELFCGKTPFEDAETPVAMLYRHVHDAPTPPTALRPELHPDIERWLLALLAKLPEDRPTASDAREQLDELLIAELGPRWRRDAATIVAQASERHGADAPAVSAPPPVGDGDSPESDQGFRTFAPLFGSRQRGAAAAATATAPVSTHSPKLLAPAASAMTDDPALTQPSIRAVAAAEPAAPASPRRRLLGVGVGVGTLALAGIAGAVALWPNDDVAPPSATTAVADDLPTSRPEIAVAGDTAVIADPNGRVVRLDLRTLNVTAQAREPRIPRATAVRRDGVLIADAAALTLRDAETLAARSVTPTGPTTLLAHADDVTVVAYTEGSDNGRLCRVPTIGSLGPCIVLGFAPSGLGTSGATVVVGDATGGQAVVFTVGAGVLSRTSSIAVGRRPHGRIVVDSSGRIAVPIERGIAVADVRSGQMSGTIALPTTPVDIAAVPDTGRIVAALPGSDQVALVDAARPGETPRLIDAGTRPLAVAVNDAGRAIVVNTGGSVATIDLDRGEIDRRAPLPAARPSSGTTTLTGVSTRRSGLVTTVSLNLDQPLDGHGLSPVAGRIADGSATFSLWQGGIATGVTRSRPLPGVTLTIGNRPGRVRIRVTTAGARLTSVTARLSPNGRRVIVTLTQPPPPPVVVPRAAPQGTPRVTTPPRRPSPPASPLPEIIPE